MQGRKTLFLTVPSTDRNLAEANLTGKISAELGQLTLLRDLWAKRFFCWTCCFWFFCGDSELSGFFPWTIWLAQSRPSLDDWKCCEICNNKCRGLLTNSALHMETSAKEGINVDETFMALVKQIYQRQWVCWLLTLSRTFCSLTSVIIAVWRPSYKIEVSRALYSERESRMHESFAFVFAAVERTSIKY